MNKNLSNELIYKKAKAPKKSSRNRFKRVLSLFLTVLWLFLIELFCSIKKLFESSQTKDLSGQLVLVTGGANGLGRCLALKFAEKGCNLAIVDVMEAENVVCEIKSNYNVKCQGFVCDISNNKAVDVLKEEIEKSLGFVDILVNNAGLLYNAPFLQSFMDDIEKCFKVNLVSHFKMVQVFLPGMIERKVGSIVGISSVAAKMTLPFATTYCATKYGVDGFMNSLFDELCIENYEDFIDLTTVYPGFMNTRKELGDIMDEIDDLIPRLTPDFVADEIVKGVSMRKRKLLIAPFTLYSVIQKLPDRIMKYLKIKENNVKEYSRKHFNKI